MHLAHYKGLENELLKILPELNYSPLNVLTDCLKWEIPENTSVSTGYLSRLYP